MKALKGSSSKKKSLVDADKIVAPASWHKSDCRTQEAFYLLDLCLRDSWSGGFCAIVQDPFQSFTTRSPQLR
nr:hypothetical protein [Tanacetum cinerariifolium]